MSINYVILGMLNRQPMSGYDLKKVFVASDVLYWSGNNNQIYRALVQLHEQALVTKELHRQEENPDRKVYTITPAGREALRAWLREEPALPEIRHNFLIQLALAGELPPQELRALVDAYAEELRVKLLMLAEQEQRAPTGSGETPQRALLRQMINQRWREIFAQELAWTQTLREALARQQEEPS